MLAFNSDVARRYAEQGEKLFSQKQKLTNEAAQKVGQPRFIIIVFQRLFFNKSLRNGAFVGFNSDEINALRQV